MNPGGRVLAAEIVLDPTSGDWFPYLLDLQILACPPAANAPRRSSIRSTAQPDSD